MTMKTDEPLCSICNQDRDAHANLNHEFNTEGKLVPKKKVVAPPNGVQAISAVGIMLRLCHVLAKKGLLDDDDIHFITSPPDAGSRGGPADSKVGVYPARSSG